MRIPLIALLVLAAAPLAAQRYSLHPSPSPLFARTTVTDTSPKPPVMTVAEGTGLGVITGLALGALFGEYMKQNHPCRCDDPGLEPFEFGFLGGLVGGLLGGGLVEQRQERAARRADSTYRDRPMTADGTPLTGDSLRLVGRDRRGVRGGIAGALMGGMAGYAVPHIAYALEHSHGVDLASTGTDHGPGVLPVLVSTATGALSGYLIAAALSRR